MARAPVSIVSGAASGIGRHMASALYRAGHRLMLLDVNAEQLKELAAQKGWTGHHNVALRALDVRDAAGWQAVVDEVVERFERIDYLFNIAGVLRTGYVHSMPHEALTLQLDVNVRGVLLACSVVSRHMVAQRSGHIINVASIAGISHVPGLSAYCASKHAVRGFSLSLAHELREHGVAVSVLCPDAVETPMLQAQERAPAAAMTFGGRRALTLEEVERALLEIMRDRPLERVLDVPFTGRALAARIANLFPQLTQLALGQVQRSGLARQRAREQRALIRAS
jgi:3-oxoacyl-[acyl-carrier protein] reductase